MGNPDLDFSAWCSQDCLVERAHVWPTQRMEHIMICCVCLGDNSEDTDEIIQCDNCGVTVHEGQYTHFQSPKVLIHYRGKILTYLKK